MSEKKKKKYKLKKYRTEDNMKFIEKIKTGVTKYIKKEVKPSTVLSTWEPCHKGTISVFTDPVSGVKIKAGGDMRGVVVSPSDLLLDCGARFYSKSYPEVLENKNPIIIVNIPNGEIPRLSLEFWKDLVDVIRAQKQDTLIACIGGHGRTGTCLSILAFLMGIKEAQINPIEFIRKSYCKKAVENRKQFKYIQELLNLKLEEPSLHHEYPSYFGFQTRYYNGAYWENY